MRIALATHTIPPYRIPIYSALASTPGWEFKVFCSCEREFDRHWKLMNKLSFSHKVSFNLSYKRTVIHTAKAIYNDVRQIHLPLGLWFDLWEYCPDIVISGEMGARSFIAATYAFIARKDLILLVEGTIHTERDISWKQRVLRNILCRMTKAFFVIGSGARQYLESLGVQKETIFGSKNAIELAQWKPVITPDQRIATRRQLGVSGLCYLYVGRLIELKGLNYLLDAWEIFCKQQDLQTSLLLIGDGEQKESLARRASSLRLSNVRFVGFVEPQELPAIYQAADFFVFPTLQDCSSLVVGEALASGLPVIGSKYDGASVDLIVEGKNGWIADPLNLGDLVQKLRMAWDARDKKEEMGKAGRELISTNASVSKMADDFRKAVAAVIV